MQNFAVVPFSVELESICTFTLPPLVVPERKKFESQNLSGDSFNLLFEAQDGPCFEEWLRSIGDVSPSHNYEVEELLPRPAAICPGQPQPSEEHAPELCKAKRTKKDKLALKKKAPSFVIKLADQQKPDQETAHKDLERESHQYQSPKMGKSLSEYPTDDSLQSIEWLASPGLAGSLPYFKNSCCTACKSKRFVFWFGDSQAKKKPDKFLCVDCIKSMIGDSKLVELIAHGSSYSPYPISPDFEELAGGFKAPCQRDSAVKKAETEKTEEENACLTHLVEAKLQEASQLFTRMRTCLTLSHSAQDIEAKLLAVRFLNENIDAQVRANQILKTPSLHKKLEKLEQSERVFFSNEAAKANSFLALQTILDRSRRNSDVGDLYPSFYSELKQPPSLAKKQQTLFNFDDKQLLAKREADEIFGDYTS
jgi:hypothetical protein